MSRAITNFIAIAPTKPCSATAESESGARWGHGVVRMDPARGGGRTVNDDGHVVVSSPEAPAMPPFSGVWTPLRCFEAGPIHPAASIWSDHALITAADAIV